MADHRVAPQPLQPVVAALSSSGREARPEGHSVASQRMKVAAWTGARGKELAAARGTRASLLQDAFMRSGDRLTSARPSEQARKMGLV
jgi:hypothetical protein